MHGIMQQSRAGKACQRSQVNVGLIGRIEARDEPRQHARIRRLDIARDQGQPDAWDRPHAEALEHVHVGMPAADQHDILDDGAMLAVMDGLHVRCP